MSNFLEKAKNSNLELKLASTALATSISMIAIKSALIPNLSLSASRKFGDEVVALAYSKEALIELSDEIGDPKEKESEDEFVERAKSTFADILRRKLGMR